MKARFTPILVILVIIVAAILSRFIGDSDYLFAQSSGGFALKQYPYPYPYPYPNTVPPINFLLLDRGQE